ncbi:Phosphatidylserine decarboxylase proenzyme 1,mitochondrial [Wickerhamomyces ciferrii]|uniref:Phosphatidylserine decarboxylase proenzyme 1, mitochondrial n=1 Tax=Wickerhamomyces ciferrii (strain ATCC 14091 / BCRC 22168 / CBS 111 / JCM 3599 / NBRC 0793 / NRRL Y-1031 F-60-10) TaxID=1206466 RepID=K0KJV4_WICCF|nr:Phosphatidylserine decarboxylase proenzyme 1,mitochondrial [Wickerhamomyces ciferrii]CCH41744.1 Phosphatidylserine decarboxylase proenzyme 1,mitochondrial [Wickerhamomyces ciferrii]
MFSHVNKANTVENLSKPISRATQAAATHISKSTAASRFYSHYPFPSIPRPKRNVLYYNTYYYGSQLKNGLKGKLPPIRKFSQSYYHNQWNGSSSSTNTTQPKHQLIKYIALFSISFIFYGVSAKIYHQARSKSEEDSDESDNENEERSVKPSHSWQFFCYSTLPLNAISRLWGQINSIDLPVWLRGPGYKFYSYCFGANLDEIKESDISNFKNLSEFFYRELKDDARPIAQNTDLVCPSDGKVLQFGVIDNGNIEQVKGMTYSIDSFLGDATRTKLAAPSHQINFEHHDEDEILKRHGEFAEINGISYSLDDILGGEGKNVHHLKKIIYKEEGDKSVEVGTKKVLQVASEISSNKAKSSQNDKELFYAVIYLAPGDYHRYHSPTDWVVTLRRHFIGELYSVAPYFQRTLSNLFVLNERVSLLGYWKYGFFSMTPVGATNVGSIKVNFDKDLTTNTKYQSPHYKDTSDRPVKVKKHTCYEATYSKASSLLGGYPVTKGQEVGGFMLGSTVVLVFEAPKEFKFNIEKGQKVKMGQPLGKIDVDSK